MTVLSDRWIKKMAQEKEMIKPFVSEQKSENTISYGLSSFGYDARVSNEFKIFTDVDSAIVDPKNFSNNSFVSRKNDVCIIPPNSSSKNTISLKKGSPLGMSSIKLPDILIIKTPIILIIIITVVKYKACTSNSTRLFHTDMHRHTKLLNA